MLSLFKKKKYVLAVDIGHRNVKIVLMLRAGKTAQILKTFTKPIPAGCLQAGEIINEEKLSAFLSRSAGVLDISKNVEVVTGLSGIKGFITKKIDVLKLEPSQLNEHLPFEVERYLPYDMNDIDLDYEILKKTKALNEEAIPVFVIAVLLNTVKSYNSLFSRSFLKCETLTANVFALVNIFEWSYGLNEELTFLLIDIGAEHTNIAVLHKGELIFTRSIGVGGRKYTEKIKDTLHVSMDEAEDLKISPSGPPKEAAAAIQSEHAHFCDELHSGLESFKTFFRTTALPEPLPQEAAL